MRTAEEAVDLILATDHQAAQRRWVLWAGLAITVGISILFLASVRLIEAMDGAADARSLSARIDPIAAEIVRLRERETVADESMETTLLTNAAITRVGLDVGMEADNLISIRRAQPRSLDRQPYQTQDIEIDLRNVTLEQATRLLVELETLDSSMTGTGMSIRAQTGSFVGGRVNRVESGAVAGSNGGLSVDQWAIRLVLTRYVVRPTSD